MSSSGSPILLTSAAEIVELCEALAPAPFLAVDTEFLREKTYYGELCVVQVAGGDVVGLIDTLALDDEALAPLLGLLSDPSKPKVFHAAGQDMQLFLERFGILPAPLFDTQIAASLLGYGEQLGYGALVEQITGTRLSKSQSRADWSRRPLSEASRQCAADDVIWLQKVYPVLYEALETRGRLSWLDDEMAPMMDPSRYIQPPETAYRRVKGWSRLRPVAQRASARLAAWRETRAQLQNRPRQWILRDDALVSMAKRRPTHARDLADIPGISSKLADRHGDTLLELLSNEEGTPELPAPKKGARLPKNAAPVVDLLMAVVRARAQEEELSPSLLANRSSLERLVAKDTDSRLLQGWRGALIGKHLMAVLEGDKGLKVVDGSLQVHPID